MREVELKGVVADEAGLRRRLAAVGAMRVFEGSLHDRRYDSDSRVLATRDQVLRLRIQRDTTGARATLEYKGASRVEDGYKVREECGTAVEDAEGLAAILASLGYVVTREVEREVAVYAVAGATVRVERYPRMDVLLEVEGDPGNIEAAIVALELARDTFTTEALAAFVRRFESRTGQRAALCRRELDGDFRYRLDDA